MLGEKYTDQKSRNLWTRYLKRQCYVTVFCTAEKKTCDATRQIIANSAGLRTYC